MPTGAFTLSYRAEAVYAGGKLTDDFKWAPSSHDKLARPQDLSGYAFLLGTTANFGGITTVSLEGGMALGISENRSTM